MNSLEALEIAAGVVRSGGVIAYPAESCFGLGCDPSNRDAIRRILKLKRRCRSKGLILIADRFSRLSRFVAAIPAGRRSQVLASWPGPFTWLLPPSNRASHWLRGDFDAIAVRVTACRPARRLCQLSRMALVSTSANRAGEAMLSSYGAVRSAFAGQVDFIVPIAAGRAQSPSTIIDARTGAVVRG